MTGSNNPGKLGVSPAVLVEVAVESWVVGVLGSSVAGSLGAGRCQVPGQLQGGEGKRSAASCG
jgi:hypothetical protein